MNWIQRVLPFFAAISLFVAIIFALIWATRLTPQFETIFMLRIGNDAENVSVTTGFNFVYIEHFWPQQDSAWNINFDTHIAFSVRTQQNVTSFLSRGVAKHGTVRRYEIGFGYFPAVFMVLPSIYWLPSLLRQLRRYVRNRLAHPPGICRECGYDLRATPDRCPECGKVVEKAI